MRAMLLGGALLLALTPLAVADPLIDVHRCIPERPGLRACVVSWDEPPLVCVEGQVGARYFEECVVNPEVPPIPASFPPSVVCPIDRAEAQVCLWTYGGVDEGCLETWILGEFWGTCYTLPAP